VSFLAAMQEKLNRAPDDTSRERLLKLLDEALGKV
jgi:hypothetical protein